MNSQNDTVPAVSRTYAMATKKGPAAPVTRSAARSRLLKHRKTTLGQQAMADGGPGRHRILPAYKGCVSGWLLPLHNLISFYPEELNCYSGIIVLCSCCSLFFMA